MAEPATEPSMPAIAAASGTESQVEWATRIKGTVAIEFARVAAAFRAVAAKQDAAQRARTHQVLAILEDKRAIVMANDQAGYFIRDWQEIGDQVRRMISHDARYPPRLL